MKKVGFPTDGNSEVVEYRYLPALSTYLHIYQHYLDIYIFTYLPAISTYLPAGLRGESAVLPAAEQHQLVAAGVLVHAYDPAGRGRGPRAERDLQLQVLAHRGRHVAGLQQVELSNLDRDGNQYSQYTAKVPTGAFSGLST